MALFRSEEMALCQMFLQSEAAYACVSELGELGLVQFRDLNPNVNAFQRKFVNEVRRCDEMERKLRFVEKEMTKEGITMMDYEDNPRAPFPREMVDLEAQFEKLEGELRELNVNSEALRRNYMELLELREVLQKTQYFFAIQQGTGHQSLIADAQSALVHEEYLPQAPTLQLGFVAGVIARERMPAFERILWFACRGNAYMRFEEIAAPLGDPHSPDFIHKCVFVIFFQGEQLKAKVRKICEGYRATLYPCPESPQDRMEMMNGVTARLDDLYHVLETTKGHRQRVLMNASKEIHNWILKVRKIKAIYHTLNMCNFDVSANSLIAEVWCPTYATDDVRGALNTGTQASGSTVPSVFHIMRTDEAPPTYYRTNKFTAGFQSLVDAYGISSYREVNPGLFTVITFPFLFGVMFGDAGHGVIMLAFALWMVLKENQLMAKKIENDIWKSMFGGRYIILLMSLFSIYTGLGYNDVYSKSLNIFGTSWHSDYANTTFDGNTKLQMDPNTTFGAPYFYGVDPIWQMADNKITFTNGLKMKMSIILGVSQMMFGVILGCFNHVYFWRPLNLFCQFIPEVLFLMSIFGYLCALIFYKWIFYDSTQSYVAPQLLLQLINMFMMKYGTTGKESEQTFYASQQGVQTFLVVLAVLCIPWMLLIKPIIIHRRHKRSLRVHKGYMDTSGAHLIPNEVLAEETTPQPLSEDGDLSYQMGVMHPEPLMGNMSDSDVGEMEAHHSTASSRDKAKVDADPEYSFGEVFIHQAIHTIEYCLGCVSNTASYLRLWALSLAHAQLSEVLWMMVMKMGLSMDLGYAGAIILVPIFAFWAVLTIAILLIMEGLSAFLHALRLHWVEFQNKFYEGMGYQFLPYSFKDIMDLLPEETVR